MSKLKELYKNFVINYKPFTWELNKTIQEINSNNKHSFEIGFIRFFKVFEFLHHIKKINKSWK